MKRMKPSEYLYTLKERFGEDTKAWKVICPSCKTVQSVQDFNDAGISPASDYFGFSCIGRFDDSKGCDWSLGGLFQIHTLELIDEEGSHPRFEIAEAEVVDEQAK